MPPLSSIYTLPHPFYAQPIGQPRLFSRSTFDLQKYLMCADCLLCCLAHANLYGLGYMECILRTQLFLRIHRRYLLDLVLRKTRPFIIEMHLILIPSDFFMHSFLGAISIDLPGQARKLISALKSRSDFQDSWKLLTVWIGGNDLCAICKNDKHTVDKYVGGIRDSLDMFHREVSSLCY